MATVQAQITAEVAARKAADTALGTRIDKEVAARVAGDGALATKVAALEADVAVLKAFMGQPGPVTPPPSGQKVVSFTASGTRAQFLAKLNDMTVDVIELAAGTYTFGYCNINIIRSKPVTVRPAAGAVGSVIIGGQGGQNGWDFGISSLCSYMTFEDLIFDDFVIGANSIIGMQHADHITFRRITCRNSCSTGLAGGQPEWESSWFLYLSSDGTYGPTNIVFDDITFTGGRTAAGSPPLQGHTLGALQSYHGVGGSNIQLSNWTVSHAMWTIYWNNSGSPASGVTISDWQSDSSYHSLYLYNGSGTVSDIVCTNVHSASPTTKGAGWTDGGGNSGWDGF